MDEVAVIQGSLDRMAESITALGSSFRMERMMNGGLSEQSAEELLAVKIAVLQAQLALREHGILGNEGAE